MDKQGPTVYNMSMDQQVKLCHIYFTFKNLDYNWFSLMNTAYSLYVMSLLFKNVNPSAERWGGTKLTFLDITQMNYFGTETHIASSFEINFCVDF